MNRRPTVSEVKVLRRRTDGGVFHRIAPAATFLSQMIAGQQGPLRPGEAAQAYALCGGIAIRRMPAGYRTTQTA